MPVPYRRLEEHPKPVAIDLETTGFGAHGSTGGSRSPWINPRGRRERLPEWGTDSPGRIVSAWT